MHYNPAGLWFSCNDDWINLFLNYYTQKNIKFSIDNVTNLLYFYPKYVYFVNIPKNKPIIYIKTKKDLDIFIKKYSNIKKATDLSNIIDWKKLYKKVDGIQICPYMKEIFKNKHLNNFSHSERTGFDFMNLLIRVIRNEITKDDIRKEWYREWDVGSGVIWRIKGITIKEII